MKYRVDMFNIFNMTNDEKDFVANVDASGGMNMDSAQVHSILSNFFLAKQIEASSKSSDRHSLALNIFTSVLAAVGVVQVVLACIR